MAATTARIINIKALVLIKPGRLGRSFKGFKGRSVRVRRLSSLRSSRVSWRSVRDSTPLRRLEILYFPLSRGSLASVVLSFSSSQR